MERLQGVYLLLIVVTVWISVHKELDIQFLELGKLLVELYQPPQKLVYHDVDFLQVVGKEGAMDLVVPKIETLEESPLEHPPPQETMHDRSLKN